MTVILISRDLDLYKLCREILNEFHGVDSQLTRIDPGTYPPAGSFYIWDDPTRLDLPPGIDQRISRHLFLVHRNDVAKFQDGVDGVEATILLKPATRACLAAFLGFATSNFHDGISTATSLRADRDEILQCLIQSNLQLQEYDQDRTNFLARAVHDFRAPLTATGGYCGLLLSEALGALTEEQKEVLRRMQHSTKRLSRMASAMFELSVGRHIKRNPDLRKGDIRECVEQALHEVNPFADSKHLSIDIELDQSDWLYMEPGQIEQVLINLLDNACKFTPKCGSIEVRGYPFFWERRSNRTALPPATERRYEDTTAANSYRVDIRGSGPSIPREHLDKIFEEYTSYGGGQDRSGGGLGLAICRMIITAHSGRVWAENTELGPRFSFVLPVRPAESGKAEHQQQQQLINSEAS